MDIRGGNITGATIIGNPAVYTFTNFTFTNANAVGNTGPSLSSATTYYTTTPSYSGNTWVTDTNYFDVTNGIQYWTVPQTGTYTIVAAGASGGGNVGLGAQVTGTFTLTRNETIRILVGQMGNLYSTIGAGGGGTFVIRSPYNTTASILAIAGGGGGQYSTQSATLAGGSGDITGQGTSKASNGGGGGGTNGSGGNATNGGNTGTGQYSGVS